MNPSLLIGWSFALFVVVALFELALMIRDVYFSSTSIEKKDPLDEPNYIHRFSLRDEK